MGFRKGGYFYDQFLMSPSLANQMADGGELQKDCGILAFDIRSKMMRDAINRAKKTRSYGLGRFTKHADIDMAEHQESFKKAEKDIVNQAANDATFIVSDHRIIWMQLSMW